MRPRKKKHGEERLKRVENLFAEKNDGVVDIAATFKGVPEELRLELGCGKGDFACNTALREPQVSYLALEKVADVIMLAMEKADAMSVPNLRFIHADASDLGSLLPEHCVDVLYINFCDPWPKKRNAKRRLTFRGFLESYKRFLKPGGHICFKTDNRPLFDFSLCEFEAAGYRICDVTYDLHSSEYANDNVMTEYERTFSERGVPINRLVAYL